MSSASGPTGRRSIPVWALPAVVLAGLAALQARALWRVPLAAFGADGAEFIPHLQRVYADRYLEHHGWIALAHPWQMLRGLDGHYPALLHMVAAVIDRLAGQGAGFARASWLCFAALAVAGWASGRVLEAAGAREGDGTTSGTPGAASGALAMALTLLVPGMFAAARRYYYDLPMTAAILLAAVCLVDGRGLASIRRALAAALLSAAALLIKWAAGLYLAPLWLLGLALRMKDPERARAWRNGLLALGLAGALVAPVASRPEGSFAFEWRLGWAGAKGAGVRPGLAAQGGSSLFFDLLSGLRYYAGALWSAGLGPGFCVAAGLSVLLAATTPEGRRVLRWAGLAVLPVVTYLCVRVTARDGRYLIPLLPWAALVMAAGVRSALGGARGRTAMHWGWRAWAGAVGMVALVQVAWVDLPDSRWQAAMEVLEGGRRGAGEGTSQFAAGAGGYPPRDGWRSWWWSGARRDVASPARAFERFARAALALGPGGRVMVVAAPPTSSWIHAWQFSLAVVAPDRASLVAPPEGGALDRFLTGLEGQVDVVVACGPEGEPGRVGEPLAAVAHLRGGPGEVGEQFRAHFPVYRELREAGLEVHLYARGAGEGR